MEDLYQVKLRNYWKPHYKILTWKFRVDFSLLKNGITFTANTFLNNILF